MTVYFVPFYFETFEDSRRLAPTQFKPPALWHERRCVNLALDFVQQTVVTRCRRRNGADQLFGGSLVADRDDVGGKRSQPAAVAETDDATF